MEFRRVNLMLKNILLLSLCGFSLPLSAQITLDGTLGPQITLPGPNYQIGAKLGQQHGSNLFHSFSDFNILLGERVMFTGPDSINNIISRVTGGQVSHLNGLLCSTIPRADIYLINPAGIHFGPYASVDILGSFHASSAEILRFEDGSTFNASQLENSTLTVASVTAFGFLTDSPSTLTIENSQLSVPEKQSFSLFGGDITIKQAQLQAPFGRLNLASVAHEGEIALKPQALKLTGPRGNITIQDSQINLNGKGGGAIYLQGGQIVIRESEIEASTLGTAAGRGINIRADQLTMKGGYLRTGTQGTGRGSEIDIEAGSINLETGAQLITTTVRQGPEGKITLTIADTLPITGKKRDGIPSIIRISVADSSAIGDGGDIDINAQQITLAAGDQILINFLSGQGGGGNLILTATDTLLITGEGSDGNASSVVTSVQPSATGTGGDIKVDAQQITLETGGQISVSTFGQGKGSNFTLIGTKAPIIEAGSEDNAIPTEESVPSDATDTVSEEVDITAQLITEAQVDSDASPVEESRDNHHEDRIRIPNIEAHSVKPEIISKLKKCVAAALSQRSHFYIKRLPVQRWVPDDLKPSRLLLIQTDMPVDQNNDQTLVQSYEVVLPQECLQYFK
jgi:filamentous hemagglutinin family protein